MSELIHVCFVAIKARWAFLGGSTNKFGGAERQIQRLASFLASQPGFKVTVIVEDEGQHDREAFQGVELVKLDQPAAGDGALQKLRRKVGSAMALMRMIRRLSPDCVVQRCAGAETGLAQHAARKCGAKFVYMMASDHECDPKWAEGSGITGWLFRQGLRRADRIIVQQTDQQQRVRQTFNRESVILPSSYAFGADPACDGRGAIWVSRLHPLKRAELFLELARQNPNEPFLVIGPPATGQAAYHEQIRREAASVANVEFINGTPPEEMAAQYRRAAILINTSKWEGMPNTFLEGADHGLAIASLQVDPGGMLREGAGFCAEGNFATLGQQVGHWLRDPGASVEQARRGRERVGQRHDIREVGPAFARLISELT